jgi:hypothetical protein
MKTQRVRESQLNQKFSVAQVCLIYFNARRTFSISVALFLFAIYLSSFSTTFY